ncbi:unnamed protein product, partial [Prunus brigantina]
IRDCGVEGHRGPQGPQKLLDNGDFGLATWEHQSPSSLLRVLQSNTSSLGCCKHPSSHQPPLATTIPLSFLHSAAAAFQQPSQPFLSYHNHFFYFPIIEILHFPYKASQTITPSFSFLLIPFQAINTITFKPQAFPFILPPLELINFSTIIVTNTIPFKVLSFSFVNHVYPP